MMVRQAFFPTLVFCVASVIAAPAQTLQLLASFETDGFPETNLVQGFNGDLYGTTSGGGVGENFGTVFKITTAGKLTTLYTFCSKSECADGKNTFCTDAGQQSEFLRYHRCRRSLWIRHGF
jgi:uncharacterized repeat protein (TIGR03803 family)